MSVVLCLSCLLFSNLALSLLISKWVLLHICLVCILTLFLFCLYLLGCGCHPLFIWFAACWLLTLSLLVSWWVPSIIYLFTVYWPLLLCLCFPVCKFIFCLSYSLSDDFFLPCLYFLACECHPLFVSFTVCWAITLSMLFRMWVVPFIYCCLSFILSLVRLWVLPAVHCLLTSFLLCSCFPGCECLIILYAVCWHVSAY